MKRALAFRPELLEFLLGYQRKDFVAKMTLLAAILFHKRVSETIQITAVDETTETEGAEHSLEGRHVAPGVMIYEVFGAFFFGAADKLEAALYRLKQESRILILWMRRVLAVDATGLDAIEELRHRLGKRHRTLVLGGVHSQPRGAMEEAGFLDAIGRDNGCPHIEAALERARKLLAEPDEGST